MRVLEAENAQLMRDVETLCLARASRGDDLVSRWFHPGGSAEEAYAAVAVAEAARDEAVAQAARVAEGLVRPCAPRAA